MSYYKQYESYVNEASEKYGVDKRLIYAVIEQESGGNASAVSSAGAQGLMQLMPATARGLGVSDAFDPKQNIMGGTKYLSQLLDKYGGDVETALAAYNGGPGNVSRYGKERYSGYYEGVLSKMDGETVVNTLATDTPNATQTGLFDDSGLKWWGNIVLVVVILLCLGLGIAFLYFAVNDGLTVPGMGKILKGGK